MNRGLAASHCRPVCVWSSLSTAKGLAMQYASLTNRTGRILLLLFFRFCRFNSFRLLASVCWTVPCQFGVFRSVRLVRPFAFIVAGIIAR